MYDDRVPDSLLAKIRALLDKAESTTFEAEAEAFTAKAQELIARYRLEEALLDGPARASSVSRRTLELSDPYATAKLMLLTRVGRSNDVEVVFHGAGSATIVGFATDLDVTEALFTSLLVQAVAAMRRQGSKVDDRGRNRTKSFRRSFLLAFASRIGERLSEAVDQVVEAAPGDALPILASRAVAVREATEAAFPHLRTMRVRAADPEGWHAGRLHADHADLAVGDRLRR